MFEIFIISDMLVIKYLYSVVSVLDNKALSLKDTISSLE